MEEETNRLKLVGSILLALSIGGVLLYINWSKEQSAEKAEFSSLQNAREHLASLKARAEDQADAA